jgi:hypothetical protein
MQIKSIIATVGAFACMLPVYATIAADAPNASGAGLNGEHYAAQSSEIFMAAAMSEENAGMKTGPAQTADPEQAPATAKMEPAPQTIPAQQNMSNAEQSAATVSIRSTRPKVDRHRDARACLDLGDNKAIIKCANKYR